jgi:hypothetical protein
LENGHVVKVKVPVPTRVPTSCIYFIFILVLNFWAFRSKGISEIRNTPKNLFEKSPCRKPFTKQLREKKRIKLLYKKGNGVLYETFLSRFWAFLCVVSLKTLQKYLPKKSHKSQKIVRTCVAFFLFLPAAPAAP